MRGSVAGQAHSVRGVPCNAGTTCNALYLGVRCRSAGPSIRVSSRPALHKGLAIITWDGFRIPWG